MDKSVLVSYRLLPHHHPFAHPDTTTSKDDMSFNGLKDHTTHLFHYVIIITSTPLEAQDYALMKNSSKTYFQQFTVRIPCSLTLKNTIICLTKGKYSTIKVLPVQPTVTVTPANPTDGM
jgi:hypothetical protein